MRVKTYNMQELAIFNDRDVWIMDWYFILALAMALNDEPNENMFPKFAERVSDSVSFLTLNLLTLSISTGAQLKNW